MATQGWAGVRPDLVATPPKKGRRTVDELVREMNASGEAAPAKVVQTEAEFSAETRALLKALRAAGEILCFRHRPSAKGWGNEGRGEPDWAIGVRAGLIVHVEEKTHARTSRLRPEQVVWLLCAGDRGAVCRDIDELRAFLRVHGVAC